MAETFMALVVAALAVAILATCRTIPDEPLDPEEPEVLARELGIELVEAPPDGAAVTTDEIPMAIFLGSLDPALLEAIVVQRSPGDDRTVRPETRDGHARFFLPVDGLEDGEWYRFTVFLQVRDGEMIPAGNPFSLLLQLGLPRPEPTDPDVATIDPRPRLAWTVPEDSFVSGARVVVGGVPVAVDAEPAAAMLAPGSWTARPRENLVEAEDLVGPVTVVWQVRAVSPRGVLGPPSEDARIRYDLDASVPRILSARTGDLTVVARPGFTWSPVAGAVQYEIEYGPESSSVAVPGDQTRYRVPLEVIEAVDADDPSRRLAWRIRAENSLGVTTPWSTMETPRHTILAPVIVPVLPPDGAVTVVMGAPVGARGARENETPPVRVRLDRAFGLGRNLLGTEAAAELFNHGVRRGELILDNDGVLRDSVTGKVLLTLGTLDFGAQFGMRRVAAEDETAEDETGEDETGENAFRIGFLPEYRAHPAVGITWYGAVWLMNHLSRLEARVPVYEWIRDEEGGSWQVHMNHDVDGYRLPTEAEWALAAGQTRRLQPDQDNDPVVVYRELGETELRHINFLRSGDAWEDPVPPYTRAGGPTSPVGALGNATPAGVFDLMGNVWEWVRDWYHPDRRFPDPDPEDDEEREPQEGPAPLPDNYTGPVRALPDIYGREMRVVRGGAWNTPRDGLRRTMRGSFDPAATSHSIGVRPARSLGSP